MFCKLRIINADYFCGLSGIRCINATAKDMLQFTAYCILLLPTAYCYCQLRTICNPLHKCNGKGYPAINCQLHTDTAYCLLPTAYCLLPTNLTFIPKEPPPPETGILSSILFRLSICLSNLCGGGSRETILNGISGCERLSSFNS